MRAESWSEVRIGDLGEVFTGRTPSSEYPAYFGDDFPFITPGDMRQGKHARTTERSLSAEGAALLKRITLPAQSICVSCIGWQMGEVIMTDRPSFTNQQINSIVPNDNVEPLFIYYSLRPRKQELLALGTMAGVRTPILNKSAFCDLKVQLPPLTVQQRIAGILSAYDELIENSQLRIKILESMARALYREWFVHFRFPGHESITLAPSPPGDINKGWEIMKLGDMCELRKDQYRDLEHSALPLLDMAHMPSQTLAPSDTGTPDQLTTSRIVFKNGDTLFGAIRCYLHKVVAVHFLGVTNTSVLVLRPNVEYFRTLLAIVASDIDTIRWAEKQSTGTKMPVINWGVFQNMPTPIPSKELVQSFEAIAGPMLDEIGILSTNIKNLRQTRDLLLPRLLSGQIDVDTIDV